MKAIIRPQPELIDKTYLKLDGTRGRLFRWGPHIYNDEGLLYYACPQLYELCQTLKIEIKEIDGLWYWVSQASIHRRKIGKKC